MAESKSLSDRMTFPSDNTDQTQTPATEAPPSSTNNPDTRQPEESSLEGAQTDGAPPETNGSALREPEFDVQVKLSDLQADPNNPLYSAKTFEQLQLPQEILNGLYSLNFRKPSKIQERALPLLLANPATNMIGQSQSGTGKTAAFVLNMLTRVDLSISTCQAIVLAPSRELARQIVGVVQVMGQFMQGLKVGTAVPDASQRGKQIEGHIVVGTPGTMMDMIKRRQLNATKVKVLVLDEADSMLDAQNLGTQCERVKVLLPKTAQIVLFSATFPDFVVDFAGRFAPNANELTLKHEELTVEGIKQLFMDCDNDEDKYNCLVKLYGLMTIGSSIIFVKTRESADRIQRQMTAEGHKVAMLTGALEGRDRDVTIDAFRTGKAKVLITTNVLARGIDVQSVSMVVNYDVPMNGSSPDPETYLHRIGRTGRFGRVGVAITFVSDRHSWESLIKITDYYNIQPTKLPNNDWDEVEEIVKRVIKSSRAGTNMKSEE